MVKLVNEADRAVAQFAARGFTQLRHRLALNVHFTAGGQVQPAQHLQQGGLAGTGRPHDRHPFTTLHSEIHAIEHAQHAGAGAELLHETLGLQHGNRGRHEVHSWRKACAGARREARHAG